MSYASFTFTSDGVTSSYVVPWPYLAENAVKLLVNGNPYLGSITFTSSSTISLSLVPAAGSSCMLYRETSVDSPRVVFGGGPVPSVSLNQGFAQLLFRCQELAEGTRGPQGSPGGNVMAVGLFSELSSMSIPLGTTRIRTSGYSVNGFGGADYVETTNTGVTCYRKQSSNGRWFEIDPQCLTPGAVGCIPDSEGSAASNSAALAELGSFDSQRVIAFEGRTFYVSTAWLVQPRTTVFAHGATLKASSTGFVGQGFSGGCVSIRHVTDVIWEGGSIDGNNVIPVAGFNGMGVSAPQNAVGENAGGNIKIAHVSFFRCKRDVTSTTLTNGGGKGITLQFGEIGVTWHGLYMEDCTFPFSMEGRVSQNGRTQGLSLTSIVARSCKYGPYFAGTTGASGGDGPKYMSVVGRGIHLIDCGVDEYLDAGLLNFHEAAGIDLEVKVTVLTGRVTLVRGSLLHSRVRIMGSVADVQDLVDNSSVPGLTSVAPRAFSVDMDLQWTGTHHGLIHKQGDVNALNWRIDLKHAGTLSGTWFSTINTNYKFSLWEKTSGKMAIDSEVSELWNSYGNLARHNYLVGSFGVAQCFRVYKDANNAYLEPDATRDLALRDRNSVTQFRVADGEAVVINALRIGTSGTVYILSGAGSPEGAVAAGRGSLFLRRDGSAGSPSVYRKDNGTGTTGWIALADVP